MPHVEQCWVGTTEPTIGADRIASVTLTMPRFGNGCDVTGLVLSDSSGNVAIYGSRYGGPALDLKTTRMPDTTPPVVLHASLPGGPLVLTVTAN